MRIWVPRAQPAAAATAARVRAMGHDPIVAPITRVVATGEDAPEGRFDAALLTSGNGVSALRASRFAALPVFAVGRATAEAARAAGLAAVAVAEGDAAALAALVRSRCPRGSRLLHAAGVERKREPAASLRESGYPLVAWPVYAAAAVADLPFPVVEALAGRTDAIAAVLHYSRRSAALALRLAEAAGQAGAFGALRHLCLSHDVAVPLVEAGIVAHFVSARPEETALLAGLEP